MACGISGYCYCYSVWIVACGLWVWILLSCLESFCGPGVLEILSVVLLYSVSVVYCGIFLSVLYCSVVNGSKKEVKERCWCVIEPGSL